MTDKQEESESVAPRDDSNADGGYGMTRHDVFTVGALSAGALAIPAVLRNVGVRSMADAPRGAHAADLVIIGSGFAGVFAALEARKLGQSVIMLDKGTVGWSGLSPWASDSRPFDPSIYDREEWIKNLSINTEWVNDRIWTDIFLDESLQIFYMLRELGAHATKPFERSDVFRDALENANVQLIERTMVTSLLQDGAGKVGGVLGFTYDDSIQPCEAVVVTGKAVINCMGAGGYKSPGFPNWGQTFDGDAISYEAGAAITGKEFHDTHQTFSNAPAASYDGWTFAQAVTGAYIMAGAPDPVTGGLNIDGALRVSQGLVSRDPNAGPAGESPGERGGPAGPPPEAIRNEAKYKNKGFLAEDDLTIDWGGPPEGPPPGDFDLGHRVGGSTAGMGVHKGEGVFNSDYTCRADGVAGLFAAGDSLGSMLCGASYPARGFSSYGSAIQGRRAAKFASEYAAITPMPRIDQAHIDAKIAQMWAPRENETGFSPDWATNLLRNTMTPYHILYIKEPRRLEGALASIEYMRQSIIPNMIARDGHELRLAHEAANMTLNAEMKLRAGMFREESRGTHFREDIPARDDDEWHCLVLLQKDDEGGMALSKHMLPEDWKPFPSLTYREAYPRPYPGEDEYRASIGKA